MVNLIKRDLLISKASMIVGLFLIPFGYITSLPPFFITLGILLPAISISLFILDKNANINRFIISLPVAKGSIVASRFLSLLLMWLAVICYQSIIGNSITRLIPYNVFVYSWKEIIVLFSLGLIILGVYLSLLFFFKSLFKVLVVIMISYFNILIFSLDALVNVLDMHNYIIFNDLDRGIVPLIEKHISFLPFLTLPLTALVLYYLSKKLSTKLFTVKESA